MTRTLTSPLLREREGPDAKRWEGEGDTQHEGDIHIILSPAIRRKSRRIAIKRAVRRFMVSMIVNYEMGYLATLVIICNIVAVATIWFGTAP